ncbi:hypothetical protein Hanom_Chr10g00933331 [Helianthus anomalus]
MGSITLIKLTFTADTTESPLISLFVAPYPQYPLTKFKHRQIKITQPLSAFPFPLESIHINTQNFIYPYIVRNLRRKTHQTHPCISQSPFIFTYQVAERESQRS